MARIVRLHAFGGPEHLRIEERPSPLPEPGDVRLRVQVARVDAYRFVLANQQMGTVIVECP